MKTACSKGIRNLRSGACFGRGDGSCFGCWNGIGRRRRFLAASAALLALLTGCSAKKEKPVTSVRIGITQYDQYDNFISEMMRVVIDEAAAIKEETGVAVNLEMLDAAGSQSTQNEQVRKLVEKGCDVICVNLVDRTEPNVITDLAEKNNVPVIYFNRELVPEDLERWDALYYVGADAFQSGILEGEIAAEAFLDDPQADKNSDGIAQYIMLEGEAGHQDAIVRTEYSVNAIVDKGVEVEKLGYAIANWNRAQAKTQMTSMLDQFGNRIELVLANNDAMALGAIDALEAENIPREQWPIVTGIDGIEEGLEAVEQGKMAGTVYNDKEGQGKNMIRLAFALATDASLDDLPITDGKYVRMPYWKVLPEGKIDETGSL